MGQTIFTTHFLCFGKQFYSAIWIRLELENYIFRKRVCLRKLIRQNSDQFRVSVNKGIINNEKEQLYQKYRRKFPRCPRPYPQ